MASAELSESNENTGEALKWPIPLNIGIDKLDVIVKAFFQGQADTRSISAPEIARTTGMNLRTLRINIKFLQALKILKVGEGTDAISLMKRVRTTPRV